MAFRINTLEEYWEAYEESVANPEGFWADIAQTFTWRKPWEKVLEWNFQEPDIKWFLGAKLNITENCLDRHLTTRGDQAAIIFEPNDPNAVVCTYTYKELHAAVCKTANALKANGIGKGDRVCFYMPMVPELAIGLLACARIGAIHSVVFAGFSASSLADRIIDAACKMVICSDYNDRGAKHIPVKQVVDEAIGLGCKSVETVLVHKNTGGQIKWVDAAHEPFWVPHPLRGKPVALGRRRAFPHLPASFRISSASLYLPKFNPRNPDSSITYSKNRP